MRKFCFCAAVVLALGTALLCFFPVQSAKGVPGSPEFGYGVWLYLDGGQLDAALQQIPDLNPDWVAIEIPWSVYYPAEASTPDYTALDETMQILEQSPAAIMFSITRPPAWAVGAQGPDATKSTTFIRSLLERYPQQIEAVELFPAANTSSGWGAPPASQAYMNFYRNVAPQLVALNPALVVAMGGLTPLSPEQLASPTPATIDDLVYLQGLYDAGIAATPAVISVRLDANTGDAMTPPDGAERRYLRHYEEIRQVMLKNNHAGGKLWVTRLAFPDGKLRAEDQVYRDEQNQAIWLFKAFTQLRSQLYVGVTFLQSMNPAAAGNGAPEQALVLDANKKHPFYTVLRDMIVQNSASFAKK